MSDSITNQTLICTVDGCERPIYAHGLCTLHWQRWRRNGDPTIVKTRRGWTADQIIADELNRAVPDENGCLIAQCSTDGRYPCVTFNRRNVRVARMVLEQKLGRALRKGDARSREVIRHTCDNTMCINPDHLIPGTMADNCRDRDERGRNARKLSDAQVLEIRARYASGDGTHRALGLEYGVTRSAIGSIIRRKTWNRL